MAYVFGIEGVPIFEMLFIISVLLFIGLIFVLLELKRLNSLINKEDSAISRFEEDMRKFEDSGEKRSSEEVVDYVRKAFNQGLTSEQVQSALIGSGWPMEEIQKVLKKASR